MIASPMFHSWGFAHFTLGMALTGAHGMLTLNADGSYTYVINESDAMVQGLNPGGTLLDSFNYTLTDGSLTDTAVLTVTIHGANDAPVNTVPGAPAANGLPRTSARAG